jgi:DNA ligase (NAD+)
MEKLIKELNAATVAYDKGTPIMTDKEWDDKFFQLVEMENDLGWHYPDSPTQKIYFETISELKKVQHNHPMLSLAKTKNADEVKEFIGDKNTLTMCKMDGLTCSLHYVDGRLVCAETRGNGIEGEDVTHNAFVIKSIPNYIPYKEELVIDGEIICTYDDFKEFSKEYKHPRNFAAGSIRLLDAEECAKRKLTFVAWDIVKGMEDIDLLSEKLFIADKLGFIVVPLFVDSFCPDDLIAWAEECGYPIDGLVVKYNNCEYYQSLGRTDNHFRGGIAYKFYDETYETHLKYIEWTMGRTGVLTPVAVFEPIEIDGTMVERASLHNVSIMQEILGTCAYAGQKIEVFKANQIIPQIKSAVKMDYGTVVSKGGISVDGLSSEFLCPICNGIVAFEKSESGTVNAVCMNPHCEGKLLNKLDHFCGKKGLDIKGLSKATLEKLIDWEWIDSAYDLFRLGRYRSEWIKMQGFGEKSVDKILNAIQEARKCTFPAIISAAGIPLIGTAVAKQLAQNFESYDDFRWEIENGFDFTIFDGFGDAMHEELTSFDYNEIDRIVTDFLEIQYTTKDTVEQNNNLEGITVVITGKLKNFKNRDELKAAIEAHGGKVAGSVSKNTKYLINNDNTSASAKNVSAQKLGIPVVTEEEFIKIFKI